MLPSAGRHCGCRTATTAPRRPGSCGVAPTATGAPDAFFDADGNAVTATDIDGDGTADSFVDADVSPTTGTDTDGDDIPDTLVDADGRALRAVDTNADGTPDTLSNGAPITDADRPTAAPEPRATILRGNAEIDGDPTTVAIALTPIELGAAPSPTAAPIGIKAAQPAEPRGKLWSACATTLNDVTGTTTRRTVAIAPDSTVPGVDGVWLFTDVLQGQSYEVSFSSPGYDTQSFVLTPRADGEPIDLDVTMKPSAGSLSGTVVGPSGALGGAEIRITDGTLEFLTTSASGSGAWSLQGISTPGVYTVTATLRGYATAVRQLRLSPGDTPSGVTLQMVPGLGTITGLISANATGLGGVTVTASNGETTLTTTSLTEGNIGFYSLPQLAVPADYTVQAEIDGFVTNSRRVPLSGSLSGVDFSMTSTTSTLTGRVLSSGGGGIESAGLVISTGELQFRASTSPSGAFEIDRLPPGDYTITAEHYQHESVTEFTTLVAGAAPAPLEITLPLASGPPDVGTGSLIVSVINEDSTAPTRGINNARVTLSRNRTTEIFVRQDPTDFAVAFEDLPIGTYTINVSADGYNATAPITKSVGLAQETVEVRLQKLGQASGIMVDSLDTTTRLTGYAVTLYRLANDSDTVGVPVGTYGATGDLWTTPPAALPTGVYRIEATSPLGYLVRNDQILDTSPEVRGRTMAFLVPKIVDAEVKPLVIPPIEADPYPTITGRIFKPRLNGVTVEYDAVDEPSLAVTGTCNGTPVPAGKISITDSSGPTGGTALFDTFSLTKEAVAELIPTDALPSTCEFTVTAASRVSTTIRLANVVASDGLTRSDRLAAAALVKQPGALTGTVFWFDKGVDPDARVPLGNVAIAAAAPVITGFASTERSSQNVGDPLPVPVVGASTATSDAAGAWTLTGQVFGAATYVFTAANFSPGSVPVTINETTRVIPATGTNANVYTDAVVDGAGFGIELTPPNPGTISGKVTIQTTSTPKYGTDMVRALDPAGAVLTRTPRTAVSLADPGGDFTFADALAGTWKVTFDPLPNHVGGAVGTSPNPLDDPLAPGGSITGVDATYTELATVRVRLFDKTTGAPITAPAGLDLTAPATPSLTGPVVDRPTGAPTAGNVYELTGIPVAASAPTTTDVDYLLTVTLDGYDLSRARVGLLGATVDARSIDLPMVAGRVTTLDLYVDSLKSISGSLVGRLTGGGTENLSVAGAAPAPSIPATIAVQRVDAAGSPITTNDPAPFTVAGSNGSFSIVGAPGFYRVTPAHPEYQDLNVLADVPTNGGVSVVPNVYEIGSTADTVLTSPFQLTLRTSTLSVNALTQLTGGAQVDGAVVDRYLGSAPCAAFPATPTRTSIPTGGATITLGPGTYCLRISKYDSLVPTTEIAFPAVVAVTVPRSTAATPGLGTVVAPLPALRPTLVGRLVAENQSGGTVELLATDPVVLTSTFETNVDVRVNGTTVPNQNPSSSGDRTSSPAVAPATCTDSTDCYWNYTFQSVPYGAHEITAPPIPGYTLASPTLPVTIGAAGPTDGPTFVYKIDNASVRIGLTAGTYPSLDPAFSATDARAAVRLVSKTGAGTGVDRPYTFEASTSTLVITGVAPEVGNWTLSFDDALHAAFVDDKVKIAQKLDADGTRKGTLNSSPVGDLVRLTGLATQQSTTNVNSIVALSGDAVMTLTGPSTYTLAPTSPSTSSTGAKFNGTTYLFDVAPGTYTLTTTKTDYIATALTDLPLTPAGTMLAGQNVAISKQATVTVAARNRGLALPPGLMVDLLNVNDLSVYGPSVLPSSTPATDPTASFQVPAGTYRARTVDQRAGVTTYPQQSSTPNATVGVGAAPTISFTLPRITRFAVTGPPSTTTVSVAIPTLTSKQGPGGSTIEFSETTTTGTLSATVSAPGYRTKVVSVPAELFTISPVSLAPNVTATGTIGATSGTVTATAPGMTPVTGTVAGTGTYTVNGLGVGPAGEAKSWTITYDAIGTGVGSSTTTIDVTPTSDNSVTGPAVTVTPRPVKYDFTVTTGASTAVPGAAVTISPAPVTSPPATDADGKTSGVVNENVAFTWTVKKSGYLTRYGSFPKATSLADVPVAVAMIAGVNGRVVDGASGVNNATVVVCPLGAAAPCTPGASDRTFTSGAQGAFTITSDLAAGRYTVWAFTTGAGAKTGQTTLTIATNGDASLESSDIAIS